MKRVLGILGLLGLLFGGALTGGVYADDLAVSVTEKKLGPSTEGRPARAPLAVSGETDHRAYEVKIENRSFSPVKGLEARYIVFVNRQTLRMDKDQALGEKVFGRERIAEVPGRGRFSFVTEAINLRETEVDPDAARGSSPRRASDELAGIWVRIYRGNEVAAEFTRPSNLSTKTNWSEPPRRDENPNPARINNRMRRDVTAPIR